MVKITKYIAYKNIENLVVDKNAFGTSIYTVSIRCSYKKNERIVESGILNFYYFDWEDEITKLTSDSQKKRAIWKKIKEDRIPGREDRIIEMNVFGAIGELECDINREKRQGIKLAKKEC